MITKLGPDDIFEYEITKDEIFYADRFGQGSKKKYITCSANEVTKVSVT